MTFNNLGSTAIGYSGNSLRLGLLEIKPIEFTEIIKKAGLRFQRVIRKFEPSHHPQSYSELVTLENEAIFSSITIPDWFEPTRLVTEFSQRSIDSYEKDTEYKRELEKVKNSRGNVSQPLLSFV